MLRGVIVLITAMMSIALLKRVLYRHHWTALILITGGIALVGLAAVLFSEGGGDDSDKHPIIGIVLMIVA